MNNYPPGIACVGFVVAWQKSYANVPALVAEAVETNGQTLSDAQSVYNGETIPNINGSGGGTQRFLRGASTSGTTGGADSHTHARGAQDVAGFIPDPLDPICLPDGLSTLTTDNHLAQYSEVVFVLYIK